MANSILGKLCSTGRGPRVATRLSVVRRQSRSRRHAASGLRSIRFRPSQGTRLGCRPCFADVRRRQGVQRRNHRPGADPAASLVAERELRPSRLATDRVRCVGEAIVATSRRAAVGASAAVIVEWALVLLSWVAGGVSACARRVVPRFRAYEGLERRVTRRARWQGIADQGVVGAVPGGDCGVGAGSLRWSGPVADGCVGASSSRSSGIVRAVRGTVALV